MVLSNFERRRDDIDGNSNSSAAWVCQRAIDLAVRGVENYALVVMIEDATISGWLRKIGTRVVSNDYSARLIKKDKPLKGWDLTSEIHAHPRPARAHLSVVADYLAVHSSPRLFGSTNRSVLRWFPIHLGYTTAPTLPNPSGPRCISQTWTAP